MNVFISLVKVNSNKVNKDGVQANLSTKKGVTINLTNLNYIEDDGNHNTIIYFTGGESITVEGEFQSISSALQKLNPKI